METVLNCVLYGVLIEIALKAIEKFLGNFNEFKNTSLCKQIRMTLKHYIIESQTSQSCAGEETRYLEEWRS